MLLYDPTTLPSTLLSSLFGHDIELNEHHYLLLQNLSSLMARGFGFLPPLANGDCDIAAALELIFVLGGPAPMNLNLNQLLLPSLGLTQLVRQTYSPVKIPQKHLLLTEVFETLHNMSPSPSVRFFDIYGDFVCEGPTAPSTNDIILASLTEHYTCVFYWHQR
jgi:hypothetical protein